MRQFKIASTPNPTQQAEAATALQWLEQQPVPEGLPDGLYAAEVVPSFRYIVAVAKQYQICELSILELVIAGYRDGVVGLVLHTGQSNKVVVSWSWCVREGIVKSVAEKYNNSD